MCCPLEARRLLHHVLDSKGSAPKSKPLSVTRPRWIWEFIINKDIIRGYTHNSILLVFFLSLFYLAELSAPCTVSTVPVQSPFQNNHVVWGETIWRDWAGSDERQPHIVSIMLVENRMEIYYLKLLIIKSGLAISFWIYICSLKLQIIRFLQGLLH